MQDAVPDGRYPFFVRSDKVERSNRYLYDGEAILVPGEGRLGEIFHYINGKFDYHQRVYKISDFNGVAAKFVMYSMMRDFKKHALQNTAKATVDSIRLPTLTEFQFSLPKPEEQKKIGQYFSQIDSLITLHQRKCQYRGLYGYLSWEQRKLGELLLFQNGFNGSSESFGSGIPLISVMDVLDDKFITHETVRGKARLNCEEASRYCVEYGDVLFQRSSENQEDAGTSNVYLDQHVSSAFGGFVIRGKKVGEYNPIFIKYLLGSPFIREQITHRAQGAQHINVSQDTLTDVVLLMPSMREQEAVGLLFLHLDNLITLHQ